MLSTAELNFSMSLVEWSRIIGRLSMSYFIDVLLSSRVMVFNCSPWFQVKVIGQGQKLGLALTEYLLSKLIYWKARNKRTCNRLTSSGYSNGTESKINNRTCIWKNTSRQSWKHTKRQSKSINTAYNKRVASKIEVAMMASNDGNAVGLTSILDGGRWFSSTSSVQFTWCEDASKRAGGRVRLRTIGVSILELDWNVRSWRIRHRM